MIDDFEVTPVGTQRQLDAMRFALQSVIDEVGGDSRPFSTDSYLPGFVVQYVRDALATGVTA